MIEPRAIDKHCFKSSNEMEQLCPILSSDVISRNDQITIEH